MAAPDFPASPSLNQTYTAPSGIVYTWDGKVWSTTSTPQNAYWTDTGTALTPTTSTRTVSVPGSGANEALVLGSGTTKSHLSTSDWRINVSRSDVIEDTTKSQWAIVPSVSPDAFYFYHSPPGASVAWATLLTLDNVGNLSAGSAGDARL